MMMHTNCEKCESCLAEAHSLAQCSGAGEVTCTMTGPSGVLQHSGTYSRIEDEVTA